MFRLAALIKAVTSAGAVLFYGGAFAGAFGAVRCGHTGSLRFRKAARRFFVSAAK